MKPLPKEIPYQGRVLKQILREGTVAIYEVIARGNVSYGYEVIWIKFAPEEEKFGKLYPNRELYPSSSKNSNDWGQIAWSWGTLQKNQAFSQFRALAQNCSNRYSNVDQTLEDHIPNQECVDETNPLNP